MSSRLSTAMARRQLQSGNVLDGRGSYALDGNGRPASIEPAPTPPPMAARQATPDQFVRLLIEAGNPVQWRVMPDAARGLAWLMVKLGPLEVPLGLDLEGIQALVNQLVAAAELLMVPTPPPEPPDAASGDDCADLLKFSIEAVSKPDDIAIAA